MVDVHVFEAHETSDGGRNGSRESIVEKRPIKKEKKNERWRNAQEKKGGGGGGGRYKLFKERRLPIPLGREPINLL